MQNCGNAPLCCLKRAAVRHEQRPQLGEQRERRPVGADALHVAARLRQAQLLQPTARAADASRRQLPVLQVVAVHIQMQRRQVRPNAEQLL